MLFPGRTVSSALSNPQLLVVLCLGFRLASFLFPHQHVSWSHPHSGYVWATMGPDKDACNVPPDVDNLCLSAMVSRVDGGKVSILAPLWIN